MSPRRGLGISILLDYNNVTPTEFFIIGIILFYTYITTSGVRKFPILQTTIISALQGFNKTQQTSLTISLFVVQSFFKKYKKRYLIIFGRLRFKLRRSGIFVEQQMPINYNPEGVALFYCC